MSNPKLPPDWRRFASRPGMVTPATRLMDADRVRDRKSLFNNFPNLEAAVGNGWEIVAHLVSETKGEGHSLLTTFRLDLYGDGMLLRSVPHRDLQTAQTMAKGIASAIPTAFVVAGSGDFSSASFDDVPASELLAAPVDEMRWHVPGLVPSGLPTLLGGDGGTGKSLAALQLAFATVMGLPWLGHQVQQGGCIFLTAEDDQGEIRRRLAAIAERAGVGQGDPRLAGLRVNARVGEDALLGVLSSETRSTVEPTPFFHALERSIERHRPALVVLDTLADLFGGDENVRSQARQFVGLLRRLSSVCGTAVLCLSHPSLAGMNSGAGTSGSTGWSNSVRSRLYLERVFEYRRKGNATQAFEPDPDARLLTIKKTNHAQAGASTRIRWVNGVLEVDDRAPAISALTTEEASARVDDLFVSLLAALTAEGRNPGPLPSSSYAPALFAKDDRSGKVTKAAFAKAMSRLLAERRIVVVEAKRGSKRLEIAQPDYANPPVDALAN